MTGAAPIADPSSRPDPRRFAVVALAATVTDFGIAVLLVEAGLGRAVSDLAALTVAAAVSLVLHGRVTLRGDNLDRWIRQPPVFITVALVAGAVDLAVFVSIDSSATTAKFAAIGAAAVLRALFHRLVLFRAVRREQSEPIVRASPPGEFRLSVVVPAYREEAGIAVSIDRIRADLAALHDAGELEIVVVDDGSSDGTADAARAAGAEQVLVQPENQGKGAAVRAGVLASRGRTVAFTDADLAYSPTQLLGFLDAIESGFDVAIGNRHHADTETLVGTSRLRWFGSRVVNMATNLLLLGNYRDTQCGCKAFRSDAARMVMEVGIIDGFAFDIEVLHLIERRGLTMTELPVEVVNSDTSTVSAVRDGILVFVDIMRIRRAARRGRYEAPDVPSSPDPGRDPDS